MYLFQKKKENGIEFRQINFIAYFIYIELLLNNTIDHSKKHCFLIILNDISKKNFELYRIVFFFFYSSKNITINSRKEFLVNYYTRCNLKITSF